MTDVVVHSAPGPSSKSVLKPETISQQPVCSYEVVQTLGEGAFGEVLLITDRTNPNCALAMKKMSVSDGDQDKIKQIRKEGLLQKMLSRVGHDNVIRLIGIKCESDYYYLFLEYADCGELFDKIEPDVGMTPARAQFYFRQLISGLKYIHSYGIVHRDIKPENLLLTSSQVLKISDFGMATVFRHNGVERDLDMSCGTLPYAAPEILFGRKYKGEPVDVWSAGVVLITMLTGELPWEKADDSSAPYLNWISNTNLDENPWRKIDVRGLSLIRIIVTNNVANRATLDRIQRHPWFTHNYGVSEYNENPAKRRKIEKFDNIPNTQVQTVSVANNCMDENNSSNRAHCEKEALSKKVSSFSQPANMDDLILSQRIDMSQGSSNPLKRMVCRMTRFCVNVDAASAIARVSTECECADFSVLQTTAAQLLVSTPRATMMVNVYTMIANPKIKPAVMIDFRRSRGDGIEFKRMFIEVRNRMQNLICSIGNDWLENLGLTPPSQERDENASSQGVMRMESDAN
ncbi:unnamed protein product [Caenorhabditis bovis]|uniref:non-specific serine/threonine protein kinase n=1 Tax=Caenorhabditis bovis TaxID=2654633 RepID=A0A8S1E991_9PELO|nr:unnamed protein product [Caenorhabditis bovis]